MVSSRFIQVHADQEVLVGDMKINPMTISHDALEPCGYTVYIGNKKIGVATDLGCYDDYTVNRLSDCDALLIEANHDIRMLQAGPYPYQLKARILGNKGHLCNEKSGELLSKLVNDKLQGVFLGHLSKENNMPELAYEAVRVELQMHESLKYNDGFPIVVAERSCLSPIINF